MWEEAGCFPMDRWGASSASSSPSYRRLVEEIHVLLVDHDREGLIHTGKLLQICQYKVSIVEYASVAMSMLSSSAKFDVIVANVDSPDLHGFKLVQQAAAVGVPIAERMWNSVAVMSAEEDAAKAMKALEAGAFLFMEKPTTIEVVRLLWQHVVRERARIVRERDVVFLERPAARGKKKFRAAADDLANSSTSNVKKKMCTEWTQELHLRFMDAVETLGEGRLTRMQVASHLQKCRNDNWRSPEERRSQHSDLPPSAVADQLTKPRRFGSKPATVMSLKTSSSGGGGSRSQSNSPIGGGVSPANYRNQHSEDIFNLDSLMSITFQEIKSSPHLPEFVRHPPHFHQQELQRHLSPETSNFESDG
ncbi:hypothetical protein M569_03441 [Genlisea aurea]|uniref:Response regulatory domain-containing protein n=1 Tax=Genlisea aurea TaxID=192259 RepID=S8CVC8_9LAMI|nr:hypothetical protein M569_03441 [Genlisea aurea]